MDIKQTAKSLGLEEEEFIEIVQLFIQVSRKDIASLEDAIRDKDVRRVFELSHSIKGSAVNLGFTEIADIARNMELKARQNSLDGVSEGHAILKKKINLLSDTV